MSDGVFFIFLAITVICAVVAIVTSRALLDEKKQSGAAFALATVSGFGWLTSLPFKSTLEMPWWPWVVGVFFGVVVIGTILSLLSEIRDKSVSVQARVD